MTKPKLKALLPWYGSKRTQAKQIVDRLGEHTHYWELFVGGFAVLLAKPKSRVEVANDLHGGLINLARVVQHDDLAPRLFDRCQRTMFCRQLYDDSREVCRQPRSVLPKADLDWAYHYFVSSWMGRNGLSGTGMELDTGLCVRYTGTGGDPATRFRSAAESIPAWWERLRNVQVLMDDGIGLARRLEDRAGCLIYADPPYLAEGGLYLHGFKEDDHRELATALSRFKKTKVVLSYYDHPLLNSLYLAPDWAMVRTVARKHMGGGDRGAAPEVLILNKPAQC